MGTCCYPHLALAYIRSGHVGIICQHSGLTVTRSCFNPVCWLGPFHLHACRQSGLGELEILTRQRNSACWNRAPDPEHNKCIYRKWMMVNYWTFITSGRAVVDRNSMRVPSSIFTLRDHNLNIICSSLCLSAAPGKPTWPWCTGHCGGRVPGSSWLDIKARVSQFILNRHTGTQKLLRSSLHCCMYLYTAAYWI